MDPRLVRARQQKAGALRIDHRGAISVDADRLAQFRDRGIALLEGGKYADARAVLEMCALFSDGDAAILIALACAEEMSGDAHAAREHYRLGLERAARDGDGELSGAVSRWREGR